MLYQIHNRLLDMYYDVSLFCGPRAIIMYYVSLKQFLCTSFFSVLYVDSGMWDVHYQDLYVHPAYLYYVIYDYILILFTSSYISIVYRIHVQLLL